MGLTTSEVKKSEIYLIFLFYLFNQVDAKNQKLSFI